MMLCMPYVSKMHGNRPVYGISRANFAMCYNYTPGYLDNWLRQGEFEHIWKTEKYPICVMFVIAASVFIAWLFGETFKC